MSKAITLLSGGQDSTTTLFWAMQNYDEVLAVSIDYGQRHRAELECAQDIVRVAGCDWIGLEAPMLQALGGNALVDVRTKLEGSGGYADAAMPEGLPTSFVPGRNALFLTMAAAVAVKHGAKDIVTGVCQTDYSGYPDCRRSFIDAMEAALSLAMPSSAGPLRIITPLMHMTKAETVRLADRLGEDCWKALGKSLTCYNGKRPGCADCPACELREAGFREAGFEDPAA